MKKALCIEAVVFVASMCLIGSAGALAAEVAIPIDNPGFEYPVLVDDDWGYSMDDEGWGYYNNDGSQGPWNPTTEYPGGVPEGQNVGWTSPGADGPGGFAQVLTDPEAVLKADWTYTLTVEVGNAIGYDWGGYKVQLLAGGTPHTPGDGSDYTGPVTGGTLLAEDDSSLAVPDGTFMTSTVTYSYNPMHSALVGQPLQIRLLALVPANPTGEEIEVEFDDVRLTGSFTPDAPFVDAGPDMISWSGQAVQLDPNVVNRDVTPLTFAWTADPDDGVVFDPGPNVEGPAVTITKPALFSTSIPVANAGFETPVLTDGGEASDPPNWADGYYDLANPTEWVVDEALAGVYNPDASMGYGGVVPEGENVAYTTASPSRDRGLSQVLSASLEANTRYELSVLVGNPFLFNGSTTTANYRVELLAGGVLLASDTGPSPINDQTWKTATVVYDSGEEPAQLGEPLEIRLIAVNYTEGKGVDFDDVQLVAKSPPQEPYVVKLTLAVNNEGSTRPDVKDDLTIDVYDDACEAAKGIGLKAVNPGDLDGNCITDANDLNILAEEWLNDTALAGPVPKP